MKFTIALLALATAVAAESTVTYSSCPPSSATSAPVSTGTPAPYPTTTYSNPLTVIYPTGTGHASGTGVSTPYPTFTGAASANKVGVLVGAVVGVAAWVL